MTEESLSREGSPAGSDEESAPRYYSNFRGSLRGFNSPGRPAAGRGVTLSMLIKSKVLQPGQGLLSMEYLGRKFAGDLADDGRIFWEEGQMTFASPSAWAIHCKRLVNPEKKSGCGWASVRYKGKKLDRYKALWASQNGIDSSLAFSCPQDDVDAFSKTPRQASVTCHVAVDLPVREQPQAQRMLNGTASEKGVMPGSAKGKRKKGPPSKGDSAGKAVKAALTTTGLGAFNSQTPIPYAFLTVDMPPSTLIQSVPFEPRMQPFQVTVSSTCLLVMDFHCHLWQSSVVGYLAGQWDAKSCNMSISHAFPCMAKTVDDLNNLMKIEEEICTAMGNSQLKLVGWYHSHPVTASEPSVHDITSQAQYQSVLADGDCLVQPCVGFIVSPYWPRPLSRESSISAFCVRDDSSASNPRWHPQPMQLHVNFKQDMYLSQDVMSEMKRLAEFYHQVDDAIAFDSEWQPGCSFIDKIKASIVGKFPRDQVDGSFMAFVHNLLTKEPGSRTS